MKEMIETPVTAVTLFSYLGQVKFDVLSNTGVNTRDVKEILQLGIDEITRMEVMQEQQKQAMAQPPPPEEPDDEPLNDSEVPDNVHPDPL